MIVPDKDYVSDSQTHAVFLTNDIVQSDGTSVLHEWYEPPHSCRCTILQFSAEPQDIIIH